MYLGKPMVATYVCKVWGVTGSINPWNSNWFFAQQFAIDVLAAAATMDAGCLASNKNLFNKGCAALDRAFITWY